MIHCRNPWRRRKEGSFVTCFPPHARLLHELHCPTLCPIEWLAAMELLSRATKDWIILVKFTAIAHDPLPPSCLLLLPPSILALLHSFTPLLPCLQMGWRSKGGFNINLLTYTHVRTCWQQLFLDHSAHSASTNVLSSGPDGMLSST